MQTTDQEPKCISSNHLWKLVLVGGRAPGELRIESYCPRCMTMRIKTTYRLSGKKTVEFLGLDNEA